MKTPVKITLVCEAACGLWNRVEAEFGVWVDVGDIEIR